MTKQDATSGVLRATGRAELGDAIAWLAEDHPMPERTDWGWLLRALAEIMDTSSPLDARAIRRVTREATRSDLDTSRIVCDAQSVPPPTEFANAMTALVEHSEDGSLASLTPNGLWHAQHDHPLVVETICLAVGIAYSDAQDWFSHSTGEWTMEQITELFNYIDDLVKGNLNSPIPGCEMARGVELICNPPGGWEMLDELRSGGVPYELLLAQRYVGGVWLLHKNKTSGFLNSIVADMLCNKLETQGIDVRRAKTVGGPARQKDLQELSGIADKRVAIVTVGTNGRPTFGVAFSSARNGGTARANGDGLLQIPKTSLPFAIVLTGPGWSHRSETDRLVPRYAGRLFTEHSLDELGECIAEVSS